MSTLKHRLSNILYRFTFGEWVSLFSGIALVLYYAWIIDDAFIYFRYVDNFLFLGNGLVYNRGEFVEGYSSPLWCLLLILLRGVGLDFWVIVRGIGVLCFAAFWLSLVHLNRRLSPEGAVRVSFPVLFLSFHYGLLTFFTSGLESPLIACSAAVFALAVLNPVSSSWQLLLGITPLVRHELSLPLVIAAAWMWWRNRKLPWVLIASTTVAVGVWLLFRVYYYADLLPSTFYLKDQVQAGQGFEYLHDTLWPYRYYVVLPLFAGLFVWLRKKQSDAELRISVRLVIAAAAVVIIAYVVKIGGDSRHFRYLLFPFVLVTISLSGILEFSIKALSLGAEKKITWAASAVIIALSLSAYPRQLSVHPLRQSTLCESVEMPKKRAYRHYAPVSGIGDATAHRCHGSLGFVRAPLGAGMEFHMRPRYREYLKVRPVFEYQGVKHGHRCLTNYLDFSTRVVHSLGLTDAVLARIALPESKPSHKLGLIKYAKEIVEILRHEKEPGPGMYRRAAESLDNAPRWIKRNLSSLELIEKKIYNRHRWSENLALAIRFPKPIEVD